MTDEFVKDFGRRTIKLRIVKTKQDWNDLIEAANPIILTRPSIQEDVIALASEWED